MIKGDRDLDTICAISTPVGVGGISVVRVSGPQALLIVRKTCHFLPEQITSHHAYFGLFASVSDSKEAIDEVLATYFQKGKSFTGEETLEISCHGSPHLTQRVLRELVAAGARLADRGEFTYRAFMNGNLDLVQAESVLSLIQSQSDQSARQALRQLQGELSKSLELIEADLLWTLARLEVGIDFSSEGVEVVSTSELTARVASAEQSLRQLLESYRTGRMIRDGLQLVIVGEPNVGKSSLLNLLAGEDRAIVTDVAGTTRDLVEAVFSFQGIKVVATDTAGLRTTQDRVEKIGIERSYQALAKSDVIFFVFDLKAGLSASELAEVAKLGPGRLHLIGNKKDQFKGFLDEARKALGDQLKSLENFHKMAEFEEFLKSNIHFVSAFDRNCSTELKSALARIVTLSDFEDLAVLSQARHFEGLSHAHENTVRTLGLLQSGASAEFMALEMKEALILVQETLGKRFDDQIMDRVFKEFCIGK